MPSECYSYQKITESLRLEKTSEINEINLKATILKLIKKKKKRNVVSLNTVGSEYAKANVWPTGDKQKILGF